MKAAPLDAAAIARLAKLEVPGYAAKLRSDSASLFEVRHTTTGSPRLAVTVTIKPCFGCLPMQLDAWKQRREALELLVDERLRGRPDTDFDIGITTLSGVPAIYTYQAGHLFGTDKNGNPSGTYTDAYALYFNDGVNEIRVVAEYKDDPAPSKAAMVARAPREQLDRIAHQLGDAYVHAW